MLRRWGSLRGLRVQLLLWLVLPLTLALVLVAVIGISVHQDSMRRMVEELDARSARLAAAHLSDGLAARVAWLQVSALNPTLPPEKVSRMFFDGGLARFNTSGQLVEAVPSVAAWRNRPVSTLVPRQSAGFEAQARPAPFSPLFTDPVSGRPGLFIHLAAADGGMMVGFIILGMAWKVLYKAQRERRLATTGLYTHLRHPQYVGFILIMLGFLLQWPTLLTLMMFPILVVMYIRLAQQEEREALAEFGEAYARYAANTPAFIPRLTRLPAEQSP